MQTRNDKYANGFFATFVFACLSADRLILTCYTRYMSLTSTARQARLMIQFGWMAVFIPILAVTILRVISSTPDPGGSAPPPTFNAKFGKLPKLDIETIAMASNQPTVRLDLVQTQLPTAPQILEVFPILSAPYGFLSRDRALALARNLQLTDDPQVLDETQLVWRKGLEFLTMNSTTLNFRYTYDYRSNPTVFRPGNFAREELAVNDANAQMERLGILGGERGPDLSRATVSSQKLRYDGRDLVSSSTLAQASVIRVDYFRIPINEIKVVSPDFYSSRVNVFMSAVSNPKMLEINYTYWEFDRNQGATYPVLSTDTAVSRFQQSPNDYIVFLGNAETAAQNSGETTINEYVIKKVELGYYDTATYQQYLQPVWIFIGDAFQPSRLNVDFVAYVPAITDEWFQ